MSNDGWVTGMDLLCPVRYFMDVVGGKWKIAILCILADGKSHRYSHIRRRLGDVTNTMLAKSLQELEQEGVVNRIQYPEIPPRVEYTLTERGHSLIPVIVSMAKWGVEQSGESKDKIYCATCQAKK